MIDFLCIGAQKAGTTWLNRNIRAHKGVWCPPFMKELHYFDFVHSKKKPSGRKFRKRSSKLSKESPELTDYYNKIGDPDFVFTDAWYEHIFSIAPEGAVKGEITPIYCALRKKGLLHIQRLAPDVRIIYLIRDPYERAMSSLRMNVERKKIHNGKALLQMVKNKIFIRRGGYKANIRRLEKVFDPKQILYVPFGWIKSRPEQVMRAVEQHLNLPPCEHYPDLTEKIHATKKVSQSIDPEVQDAVRRTVEPQYPFLLERFGEEFVKSTK